MVNRSLLAVVVLAGLSSCQASSADGAREAAFPSSPVTQLVLLGTGTPNAEPDRAGSALAIVVNGTPYLVDAGPGVVRRANEAFQKGIQGLAVNRLSRVFLTHLHTDHTLGLPDLIYTPWVLERESPLLIIGPAGTEAMARHLSLAYQNDVRVRLEGLEPANPTGYQVDARDVEPGIVYEDDNVTVTAFAVSHGSWDMAFGYRFETPDRTVVVSGDTRPTESVVGNCDGCDILVHEVYSHAKWELRSEVWKEYHAASHTSGVQLGGIAARARPEILVLTHQLLWGATPEELLAEVRQGFGGRIAYGRDLDVF
ncbi:MAG: MBL fold metallo-hydrolase [Gemmatimonadota bacterium]|jgi:ribonuclease BN (tRNA processing enzyme)